MILTNDELIAESARRITTTARVQNKFNIEHSDIGYNYRMPNINAAIGLGQIEKIKLFLNTKENLQISIKNGEINSMYIS